MVCLDWSLVGPWFWKVSCLSLVEGACACRGVDFGSVYASKTFQLRDGRRVLLGWVYETAAGCEAECSTGTNFTYSLVSGCSISPVLINLLLC